MSNRDELNEQSFAFLKAQGTEQFGVSIIQRKFFIGYNRARRIFDAAVEAEVIEYVANGKFQVLPDVTLRVSREGGPCERLRARVAEFESAAYLASQLNGAFP